MPNRSRSGVVISPWRVVAPTRVNLGRSIRTERADGPSPIIRSSDAVLHRRIEDLLDRGREPVDLVDEQDVAILEIGEQGGEVARFGDHRPGGGAKADAQLARDDLRQRRLAEARRPEEEDMVERVAAALGGLDEHAQILARRLLADELVERLGAQRGVEILGAALRRGEAVGVGHVASACVRSRPQLEHSRSGQNSPVLIPVSQSSESLSRKAGLPQPGQFSASMRMPR